MRRLLALLIVGAVAFAACGDDDDTSASDTTSEDTTATTTATTAPSEDTSGDTSATTGAPANGAAVEVGESDLGSILVDAEGFTLYAFTNDTDGTPTCTGDCAGAWPAAIVEGEPVAGDGVTAELTTVASADGSGQQLKAGDQPLYRFSGDAAAGETNGQGIGDVWYAVAPDGSLVEGTAEGDATSSGGSRY
jgi:predicted lipoprotein with Yx(FWY)xxD motif